LGRRSGLIGRRLLQLLARPTLSRPQALAFTALGALATCLRAPDRLLHPALWAEDGTIFLKEAHDAGLAAVTHAYAGYLLVFPRALASAATAGALDWAPLAFALAALLVLVLTLWRIAASPLELPGKGLWVVLPALLPHNGETTLTLVNAQWVAAPLLLLLACERPTTTRASIADAALLGLLGLSGPFVLTLWPIFVPRALAGRRRPAEWAMPAALVLTCAIQAWMMATTPRNSAGGSFSGRHLIAPLLNGPSGLLSGMDKPLEGPAAVALALLLAATLGATLWATRGPVRQFVATALVAAAILTAASMVALRALPDAFFPYLGGRYTYLPYVFTCWALLCGAFTEHRRVRWLATVVLAAAVVSGTAHFKMFSRPALDWSEVMRRYHAEGLTFFTVPPYGWGVELRKEQRR
jgi:hypothetical protein